MCNMLQAVKTTVSNSFTSGVNAVTRFGTQAISQGRAFCSSLSPRIAALVTKIQSLQFAAFLQPAVNFAKSSAGFATGSLALCITCLVAARRVEHKVARSLLFVAGLTSAIFAAICITKPFGFMKA